MDTSDFYQVISPYGNAVAYTIHEHQAVTLCRVLNAEPSFTGNDGFYTVKDKWS